MRLLIWGSYSASPNIGSDSGYNLAFEFVKYLVKYYPDSYAYILLPKMSKISLRGDEDELVKKGHLFLVDTGMPPRRYAASLLGGADAFRVIKVVQKQKIVFDTAILNFLMGYPLALSVFSKLGYEGIRPISRIDWFDLFKVDPHTQRFMTDLVVVMSRYYPVVVHSKWCIQRGLRLPLDSEPAQEILKWGIWYPYFDGEKIKRRFGRTDNDVPKIIFNHRPKRYTGLPKVVKAVKKLKEMGVKVKIYISTYHVGANVRGLFNEFGGIHGFWAKYGDVVEPIHMKKDVYYQRLPTFDAEIAFHDPDGASWSISVLEAVASGCYPISHGRYFYEEMFDGQLPKFPDNEQGLVDAIQFYVDNREYCDKLAQKLADHVWSRWSWEVGIHDVMKIVKKSMVEPDLDVNSKIYKYLKDLDVVDLASVNIDYLLAKTPEAGFNVGQKSNVLLRLMCLLRHLGFKDMGGFTPFFVREGETDGRNK